MKKKAPPVNNLPVSPVQSQAMDISNQQREAQNTQVGQANQTIDTAKAGVSPYLAGSSGMSEFRRALTGNLAHSTALTGDNAIARTRERAQAAGFGGNQPITFGAEAGLANEQAGRIAQIPAQVEAQAAPLEMQAAGLEGTLAGQQLNAAHVYNPESYFNQGTDLEQQRQNEFYRQQEEARKRKAGIWGSLAKIGLTAAGGVAGGAPGAALGASILR